MEYTFCAACNCMYIIMCLQSGASPLFIASQEGHCDVVDILLKNGASINQAMQVSESQ